MAILATRANRLMIQGITGRQGQVAAAQLVEYGTPVLAGVTPGKGGEKVAGVPVYDSVRQAVEAHGIDTSLLYVPGGAVLEAAAEAISQGIRLLVVAADGVPRHDLAKLLSMAGEAGARVIGPASCGLLSPGEGMKLGSLGGSEVRRAFVPGEVGLVCAGGGLASELGWLIKRAGFGVSTCVTLGRPLERQAQDGGASAAEYAFALPDLLSLFAVDPGTRAVVVLEEAGAPLAKAAAEVKAAGGFPKPLLVCRVGRFYDRIPSSQLTPAVPQAPRDLAERQAREVSAAREAGALVLDQLDELVPRLREVFG